MGQGQFTIAGTRGFQQAQKRYLLLKASSQHGVLGHGEPVPIRQRQDKPSGVKSFHPKEYGGSFLLFFGSGLIILLQRNKKACKPKFRSYNLNCCSAAFCEARR
jgi:hypothetical protein